jgi:hypothetical protein
VRRRFDSLIAAFDRVHDRRDLLEHGVGDDPDPARRCRTSGPDSVSTLFKRT